MLNAYARKFGFYPTLDRLVLTFWKFNALFYSTIFFMFQDNIYEYKQFEQTAIRL